MKLFWERVNQVIKILEEEPRQPKESAPFRSDNLSYRAGFSHFSKIRVLFCLVEEIWSYVELSLLGADNISFLCIQVQVRTLWSRHSCASVYNFNTFEFPDRRHVLLAMRFPKFYVKEDQRFRYRNKLFIRSRYHSLLASVDKVWRLINKLFSEVPNTVLEDSHS